MRYSKANGFFLIFLLIQTIDVYGQWHPQPAWKDSYAVDGVCYCDSNGFDHGLDQKTVETPIGVQNVVDVCNAISRVLGFGSEQNRIPYNDIQCGNGPANDAADEAGCPGRVDIGPSGCNQIGPKWDLASVYANNGNPDTGELNRAAWTLSSNNNRENLDNAIDSDFSSRWDTQVKQTPGQYLEIDFGRVERFNKIDLDSISSSNDYPRGYALFVSNQRGVWSDPLLTGRSRQPLTILEFEPQSARFVRIELTESTDFNWWSVHEVNVFNTQDATPPATPTPDTTAPSVNTGSVIMPIIITILVDDQD